MGPIYEFPAYLYLKLTEAVGIYALNISNPS